MKISSPAFEENGMIPTEFTCDGADLSPPLTWTEGPRNTESFALIVDDPDAPGGTFVHWVLYNIPPSVMHLDEGESDEPMLDNGATQGTNDFKNLGWGGPCPPDGTHHYFFKLYALDEMLNLKEGATKGQLLSAMKGHILAEAQTGATYQRSDIRERLLKEEKESRTREKEVDEASKESFPASDPPAFNP